MNRDYVSEFTRFIDTYLEQHPEVVEEQMRGWNADWHTEFIDLVAMQEAAEDGVPDDTYGFNWHVRLDKHGPCASH